MRHLAQDAFLFGGFDLALTEILIVLILKDNPMRTKDFQPISLCNILYKLIIKVLVNNLRPFMENLIGPMHIGFMLEGLLRIILLLVRKFCII